MFHIIRYYLKVSSDSSSRNLTSKFDMESGYENQYENQYKNETFLHVEYVL